MEIVKLNSFNLNTSSKNNIELKKLDYQKTISENTTGYKKYNIDKAYENTPIDKNTNTFVQTTITKSKHTNDKEIRVRKIFTMELNPNLFETTVRDLHVFYRKGKKFNFTKVKRFKTEIGTIEYLLHLLNTEKPNRILDNIKQVNYLN